MRHFNLWDLWPVAKDLIFALIPFAGGLWAWFKFRHAHSWPIAQGTILSTHAQSDSGSSILPWTANFTYTYVVNGEYHAGLHVVRARTEQRAEEKIAGWKDRMVVVRYSPDKPDVSVLLKSDQPGGQLGN